MTTNVVNPSYNWCNVTKLKPGDRVHWWGNDMEVTNVLINGNAALVSIIDTVDDHKEKTFSYRVTDYLRILVA